MSEASEGTLKEFENKIKDVRNELVKQAADLGIGVFIPTWKQIESKIKIWDYLKSKKSTSRPSELTYRLLEEITSYGKGTWQNWREKNGFLEFLDEEDDFQKQVDKGAYRVLKRLEELAFSEKSTAAVTACKAYLALSSFAKQKIDMNINDLSGLSQEDLDREIASIEKMLRGS